MGGIRDSRNGFRVQRKTVEIRATRVRIFLIYRIFFRGDFHQRIPEILPVKYAAIGRGSLPQIQQVPWVRSGSIPYGVRACLRGKRSRGIGIRKLRERGGKFGFICVKSNPRITEEMINDCPRMQQLPNARHIFSRDAQDHIEKLVEAEHLPNERAHGYISGIFFRVTYGDCFRQWHQRRIRGESLKSRYERNKGAIEIRLRRAIGIRAELFNF